MTPHQNDEPLPEVRDALIHLVCAAQVLIGALIAGDPEHTEQYNAALAGLADVDLNVGPFEE